ncbi:hypothetical protein [uncultured Methanomethylovorans sp.]|uniref:hypothetical protein n=1 Tax=uncultured Methanomethylovorans sp. TaxID=183759 RepID=UPI00262A97D6|nr:hypothetical protein [uncultured Methanomethylovorans sp.]
MRYEIRWVLDTGLISLLLLMTAMSLGDIVEIQPGAIYQPVMSKDLTPRLDFILVMAGVIGVAMFIAVKIRNRFIY